MSDKLSWMKEQLENDGWDEINSKDIIAILDGATEDFEDTLIDYILELESEWLQKVTLNKVLDFRNLSKYNESSRQGHNMENEILAFLNRRNNLRADLATYLRDVNRPLEERWKVFLDSGDILPVDDWVGRAMDIYTDCIYDDFCIERHQTSSYASIDEEVCQGATMEGEEPGYRAEFWDACYAKRDEWREVVLAGGYSGFIYDWYT